MSEPAASAPPSPTDVVLSPPPSPPPRRLRPPTDDGPFTLFVVPGGRVREYTSLGFVEDGRVARDFREVSREAVEHYNFDLFSMRVGRVLRAQLKPLYNIPEGARTVNIGIWPSEWEPIHDVLVDYFGPTRANAAAHVSGEEARRLFEKATMIHDEHRWDAPDDGDEAEARDSEVDPE
jgi:hypothetical protein